MALLEIYADFERTAAALERIAECLESLLPRSLPWPKLLGIQDTSPAEIAEEEERQERKRTEGGPVGETQEGSEE